MKAIQLVQQGNPGRFELNQVADPRPAANEVVLKVECCGLNHLDLWVEEGGLPVPIKLPRIPGGEIGGRIAEVGSNVSGWSVGDPVALQSNIFCGECEYCRRGDESLCLRGELLGVHRDGGFAGKIAVPTRGLMRLPAGVDFRSIAALTLAGSTAMHMLTERAQVQPGDWVLVMGAASGVGSAAIQIAKHLGAQVISTGSSDSKRRLGLSLGADHMIDPADNDWPAKVRQITSKKGVNLVIEHVGGDVLLKCFECLARSGTIVTCGATAGKNVALDLWPLFVKQQRLIGSYGRTRADFISTVEWIADGKLKPVVDSVVNLEGVPGAFAKLRSRDFRGKILVEPG